MLNIKQTKTDEGLLDNVIKIFKHQSHDIIKAHHVGTDKLDKSVEYTCKYQDGTNALTQQSMKNEALEKWMACLLIRNSDQSKCGFLLNGLVSQFSMENNQHPKNITNATDIMSNHKHDHTKEIANKGRAAITSRKGKETINHP